MDGARIKSGAGQARQRCEEAARSPAAAELKPLLLSQGIEVGPADSVGPSYRAIEPRRRINLDPAARGFDPRLGGPVRSVAAFFSEP